MANAWIEHIKEFRKKNPNISYKDALKKAYRNASKEHHPDRVQHLGENIRKMAEEKIKQINEAYTYLSKQMA